MKIRNRYLVRVIAHLLAWVLRGWFRLVRLRICSEVPGIDPYDDAGDQRFLYCIWHDAILGMIFSRPHERMAGLVSLHTDGAYIADIMEIFRVRPIRGSSGRRGAGAMREMLAAAQDWHIAIATDGPRGPRHEVKDGILYLASQSGRPIVPTAFVASRGWRPRGRWTDMLVPLPFATSWIVGSRPIVVPPGLRPDQLGPYREELQRAMDAVHNFADRVARAEVTEFHAGWNASADVAVVAAVPIERRAA